MPDLDELMRYWVELFGLDQPDPYSKKPWKITWGWVNEIDHPHGGEAVGLNLVDGTSQVADIKIRRPRTEAEWKELDDTCAHETSHCVGARMQALLDAGREVDAHEYLAETLAPAMVRIKGSPRAMALAKAARKLPGVSLAKGTRMDVKAILAMLAMVMAASTPEEKEKLLGELKAQLEANAADPAPASEPAPLAADPPKPEEKPMAAAAAPADGTSMGMSEEERMAKDPMYKKAMGAAVDAMLDGRPELTADQKAFAKNELGTPAKVQAFLKTVGRVETKPEGERLGLPTAPRGGAGDRGKVAPSGDKGTMRLFRIMPGAKPVEIGDDGVTLHDPRADGKLLSLSVVDAYNLIRANSDATVARDRARMTGGAA